MADGDPIQLTDAQFQQLLRAANRGSSTPSPSRQNSGGFGLQQASDGAKGLAGAFGDAAGFITRGGGTVGQLFGDIGSLGGRLPGFLGDSIEGLAGLAGVGVGFLEETNATFQNLSKVGAGFNGDLGALRAGAAQTRLPLDQFANLVGRNAQALAGLGSSVNQGARRFTELSRAMFEDGQTIEGMMNLGYTLEEANAALIDNAELLGRQRMLQGMSDQQVAQATLQMAKDMAVVADLTGKSAEEQRQSLLDAQRDGKNIAALRQLEAQGITNAQEAFNQSMTGLSELGPAAQAFYQDILQVGGPVSDLTKNFEAMNPATARQIRMIANTTSAQMSDAEKRARIQQLLATASGNASREFVSSTNLAAARMAGAGSTAGQFQADLLSSTESFQRSVESFQSELQREENEAAAREGRRARIISRSEAAEVRRARAVEEANARSSGDADGQTISRELNRTTIALANASATAMERIGANLSANTRLADTVSTALGGIQTGASVIGGTSAGIIDQAMTPGDKAQLETNQFRELFEPITTSAGLLTRVGNLGELGDALRENFGGFRADGGPIDAKKFYAIGEEGPELFAPGLDGNVLSNEIFSQFANFPIDDIANQLAGTGMPMTDAAKNLMATIPNMMKKISSSDLGSVGNEITPMINDMLAQMNNTTNNSNQQQSQSMLKPNQRMEELLDNLNQLMLQLVRINTQQTRIGKDQISAVRGAGNLMAGVRSRA